MRITQTMAKYIANKMTEEKLKAVNELFENYREFIHAEYVKQTPKPMLDALKKFPSWVGTTNSIRFEGFGIIRESVSVKVAVISNQDYYHGYLTLDHALAVKIMKLRDKHLDAKKKTLALRDKIETAINGLKTFAKIQEHLPEAVTFLPKSEGMEVMVNFSTLRQEINAA